MGVIHTRKCYSKSSRVCCVINNSANHFQRSMLVVGYCAERTIRFFISLMLGVRGENTLVGGAKIFKFGLTGTHTRIKVKINS